MASGFAAQRAKVLLDRPGNLLAGMRVRKKLIVLHTVFSLVLAGVLLGLLRPAINRVVEEAELHETRLAIGLVRARLQSEGPGPRSVDDVARLMGELQLAMPSGVSLKVGQGERLGLNAILLDEARRQPGEFVNFKLDAGENAALLIDESDGTAFVASARLEEARAAVTRLYLVATAALLVVYALIAAALEAFILPRHVYGPIRRILHADEAAQRGDRNEELVPAEHIPADELGEIIRSRNSVILALRKHEADLAEAMRRLEQAASDLQRKNVLLETAQKNLADADRLASLGVLSAGLAHEMNTPLAVAKGLAEKIQRGEGGGEGRGGGLTKSESELLVRVVARLERLSESLLDFARVRPPRSQIASVRVIVEEAWTLVRLDREAKRARFECEVATDLSVLCDPDRLTQVFVNLLRNALDAAGGAAGNEHREAVVRVTAERVMGGGSVRGG
ncbi:MAG: hypothetical protein IBJ18_14055, partial [Phycisphaerales bacterium]|nr:hypothetical protein [Phycisphaerales bacterium]